MSELDLETQHGPAKIILPPKDPKLEAEKLYHETLIKKKKAFANASCEFQLERWADDLDILAAQEKQNQIAEHNKWFGSERLTRLTRVILENPNSFDVDDNGTKLKDLTEVQEALVYTVHTEIFDSRDASKNYPNPRRIYGFPSIRGTYKVPVVRWKYGKDGSRISGEQIGMTRQYFIPFSKENVESILEKYPLDKTFNASIRYEKDSVAQYSCKSMEIFKNEKDGRAIIEANREGFMKMSGDHAVENYRKFVQQKSAAESIGRKVIVVDQATEALLKESDMSIEEIVKEKVATKSAKKRKENS